MIFKPSDIEAIAETIANGGVGIFPFDTVWGLTGAVTEPVIDRICKLKNRSPESPLLIILPSPDDTERFTVPLSQVQREHMDHYWPGPTTLVLEKRPDINPTLTGGKNSVALRYPDFIVLNFLLNVLKQPIVSTSANISGQPTPKRFTDIDPEILDNVDFAFHHTSPLIGEASQIIDIRTEPVTILR
jgi:L-threonylcarbamoyladenylate synthase